MSLAQKKVLVLNKSWRPVGIVSLERALNKVFSEYHNGEPKARIIDCANDFATMTWADWSAMKPKEGEEGMLSVNAIFRVPTVIQLTKYDKLPHQKIHYCRRTVYKRDNYTCQYCGCKPGSEELTIDHVLPRSQGGLTTWGNCVLACVGCNSKKADRTPERAGMKLLKKPQKPKYNLFKGDYRVKDWEAFLGAAYWLTELENDEDAHPSY
jgi:5-methylcytosine-specific restriction endonuclease McrA